MSKVIHFEICVDDPKRAMAFYEKVSGWEIQMYDAPNIDHWLVKLGEKVWDAIPLVYHFAHPFRHL